MTTAELFKKREEEKNNPQLQTAPPVDEQATKPGEGLNMAEARMAGNGIPQPEQTATATNPNPSSNVSLYEIGKQAGNINQAENTLAGKSPITTPEYEKFRNEVIAARDFGVETPEQAAARERRDYIKQGLTGLTEGLTSLANLYYTTKWAPNQKIKSQMPELQKQLYRERLERDKKLENFRAWQRAKAEKDADRAYQEKIFNINRQDRLARESAEAKQRQENFKLQFDYKVERDKVADQRYAEEIAYKREQDEKAGARASAQLAETKRHNQAMESRYTNNSSSSTSRSSGKGKTDMRVIDTPKGVMDVDFNRINDTTFNQLYNNVPEDVKNMFKVGEYDDKDARNYKMNAAISYALQNSEGYSDWLEKAGVGVYQQPPLQPKEQTGGKVIDWRPAINNSNQQNTIKDWTPQDDSIPTSGKELKEELDKRKKRKDSILQQGNDSLMKHNQSLKSDTFK